jgi:hypothetical protein
MQNFRELIIYIKRCPLEMYNKLTVEEFIKNISICEYTVYIYMYIILKYKPILTIQNLG